MDDDDGCGPRRTILFGFSPRVDATLAQLHNADFRASWLPARCAHGGCSTERLIDGASGYLVICDVSRGQGAAPARCGRTFPKCSPQNGEMAEGSGRGRGHDDCLVHPSFSRENLCWELTSIIKKIQRAPFTNIGGIGEGF
ncbi:hypothetical protein BDA96_01G238400 [Sorghum bicolor]|uniref:Uncharacterized protein n=2 Tax=Sorghum bicolor TaxID=4558 RepID=A0A921S099_SORBI|nr:hypothetical protein BDA96_01G238400 [Sorghum bicolor]KXG38366.1 hypothetical protein SORBI_3001G223700 [Sorghum bicolor]